RVPALISRDPPAGHLTIRSAPSGDRADWPACICAESGHRLLCDTWSGAARQRRRAAGPRRPSLLGVMGSATARLPQVVTGRTMQRSTSKKILTTHVGSLPRPNGTDRPGGEDDTDLRKLVADVVARQREIGIDVINEGEYTKGGDWLSYVDDRFGGFEARPPAGGKPIILQGK